jgi:hypothetical protein
LGIRQYEAIHPKLESRQAKNGNLESQQALVGIWKRMAKVDAGAYTAAQTIWATDDRFGEAAGL